MSRRLKLLVLSTFGITWAAWGTAALCTSAGVFSYGEPLFMVLFMLGGFGPTFAAYIAVASTSKSGSLREFHRRLFRFSVHPGWWATVLFMPFLLNFIALGIGGSLYPELRTTIELQPWYMVFPFFFMMIIGGGLEELGWRGVALPELRAKLSPLQAGFAVSVVWALWHLPLFWIPGTNQYDTSFGIFALGALGLGLILTWIYLHTESILLCIVFHASFNAAYSMGVLVPSALIAPALIDAGIKISAGLLLILLHRSPATAAAFKKA